MGALFTHPVPQFLSETDQLRPHDRLAGNAVSMQFLPETSAMPAAQPASQAAKFLSETHLGLLRSGEGV